MQTSRMSDVEGGGSSSRGRVPLNTEITVRDRAASSPQEKRRGLNNAAYAGWAAKPVAAAAEVAGIGRTAMAPKDAAAVAAPDSAKNSTTDVFASVDRGY